MTRDEMPIAYEPGKIEQKWYKFWLEKGYFKPEIDPKKKPFTIIMPPPNVTGELHIGHALTATLEDIMVRWHRMKGEPTLWLPGVDHAGIATQVVVEKMLAEEGLDRHKLGRERTQERIRHWATNRRRVITEQHQRLGISCDWSRERYTLDEGPSRAVCTAFVRLYEKGLIYRGERIINWCPRCATALSDLETEHKELGGNLYYVHYPFDAGEGFITVATTRPETMLGDIAIAVNPNDGRYKGVVGKKVILPVLQRVIPVIADEAIDPTFGTGAVKITPAHDPVDFEIAQRHDLPSVNIMNLDASMNKNAGPYAGMSRFDCRKAILAYLEETELLGKVEPHTHSVGHCLRCRTMVEPIASKQWFVKMKSLADPAIRAVTDGQIKIIPRRFIKIYLNWMENIRDWCISRQLWWGHRIPVWHCRDCGESTVSVDAVESCRHCSSTSVEQDPDVLDTWFSSALWPHSTLGWPDDTEDLRYFYPTSVMETAYDILFFWVARMIIMGLEDAGGIPFHTVYLHGLIRDEEGEKMSKVRGNVLNPLDTMEQYGTDALRFAVVIGTSPGNDSKLTPAKLESSRNFANKLWNATRFVIRNIKTENIDVKPKQSSLTMEDRWILSRLNRTISGVTKLMDDFQFAEAQRQIYHFLWSEFCDWYIEMAKIRLRTTMHEALNTVTVLVRVLESALRLLHPFMPFLTEELWQQLGSRLSSGWRATESIMVSPYPEADVAKVDLEAEEIIESIIEIVHSIRNARAQYHVESNRWIEAQVYGGELVSVIAPYSNVIETLARAKPVTFVNRKLKSPAGDNALILVLKGTEVVIPMESMVDLDAEKKRLHKEIEQIQAETERLETLLEDKAFLAKAPGAVVEKEKLRLYTLTDKLKRLKKQIKQ